MGRVILPIGYFANVIEVDGSGIAMCTDGVGSKTIIATMMGKYDTIGIDCVAMNVNDMICVGAKPVSMVDYIAIDQADAAMLDAHRRRAVPRARGRPASRSRAARSRSSRTSSAASTWSAWRSAASPLDQIIVGHDVDPGDRVIGIASNGIHSNGYSLARRAFFERRGLSVDHVFAELGCPLGEELLRPTLIYVPEVLEILEQVKSVKALIHITGDGLLNLPRVDAEVGFVLDNLPTPPPIFELIQRLGGVSPAEMFEVYNMGVGFCIVVPEADVAAPWRSCRHGRQAGVIGHAVADPSRAVTLPQHKLVGRGKRFTPA